MGFKSVQNVGCALFLDLYFGLSLVSKTFLIYYKNGLKLFKTFYNPLIINI